MMGSSISDDVISVNLEELSSWRGPNQVADPPITEVFFGNPRANFRPSEYLKLDEIRHLGT